MAKVITLSLQKGGVSKSTTTGILAYLLSKDGNKVLTIDLDSQGNLTEFLTERSSNDFLENSIFEAIVYKDVENYIYNVRENLDIIPANNLLALFSRWVYTDEYFGEDIPYEGDWIEQLAKTIEPIREEYDFILIDTPPSLGEPTTNAFFASDYCIVMYESSYFCYRAVPNFMETLDTAKSVSPYGCEVLGIIRTLNDKRRGDAKLYNEKIEVDYPNLVFNSIITRKASTGRLPAMGFDDNPELNDALKEFKLIYKEIKERLDMKEVAK